MTEALRVSLAKPVTKSWGRQPGGARQGILLHYDASRSDKGAVAWLEDDARAEVSYHYLILDSGDVLQIAPPGTRAYHAGVCKPSRKEFTYSDGNNAFYGVAIAATDGEHATPEQVEAVVQLCHYLYWLEGWNVADTWRITGHDAEAWPRGRKVDPVGERAPGSKFAGQPPVLSVQEVQDRFAATAWAGIP